MSLLARLFLLLLILFHFSNPSFAQDNAASGPQQVGLFYGRVLPNKITEEDEIFAMWGGRYSIPSGENSYYDFGVNIANDQGIKWQGAFASLSMHIPLETLIGHAGLGLDFTRLEVEDEKGENSMGVHFVGGIMSKIGRNSYLRFDMKLNSKPGTSLFFALGLVFNLGSEAK